MDSGCSNHMTGNESIFINIDKSVNSPVKMGNGALVNTKGKGTIEIQTKEGPKHVQEVLLLPDLEQNLVWVK